MARPLPHTLTPAPAGVQKSGCPEHRLSGTTREKPPINGIVTRVRGSVTRQFS